MIENFKIENKAILSEKRVKDFVSMVDKMIKEIDEYKNNSEKFKELTAQ
jgi:hypothetical protein